MEIMHFAKIDGKKSKRESIFRNRNWDRDEILFIVKYKQYIRKNGRFEAFWALIQETMRYLLR
jgi:hypothetical protein